MRTCIACLRCNLDDIDKLIKIVELKLISNWKELKQVPDSETHTLEIGEHNGWIQSLETGKNEVYLSTHTFYGSTYKYSSHVLQKHGFNVQLKSWGYVELEL